jgi:hypothetical protein
VVARGDHVDPGVKEFAGGAEGESEAPRGVLAVADHEVSPELAAQGREHALHRHPAGPADHVPHREDTHS